MKPTLITSEVIAKDPAIKTNEQAYEYWMEKIADVFGEKQCLLKVSFKFKKIKRRSFKDTLLFRYPLELEESAFTTSFIWGLKHFDTGSLFDNGKEVHTPTLLIKLTHDDLHKFMKLQPVDILDITSGINIDFSDLLSVAFHEEAP